MFERFTERARQVMIIAQDEARAMKHAYIGVEHILIGLIREDEGLGSRTLLELGLTAEDARRWCREVIGEGVDPQPEGQLPFTPRAKKVLELALREGLSLGQNYIGTEHILLGLVRENGGAAAKIMEEYSITADAVRDRIIQMLSRPGRRSVDPVEKALIQMEGSIAELRAALRKEDAA